MQVDVQRIKNAAAGLLYQSESDYHFEAVLFDTAAKLEDTLNALSEREKQTQIKVTSLEQFFRNITTIHPNSGRAQQHTAQRFEHLKQVLKEELQEVAVYLLGEIEVDAFILGRTGDGSYAGLRTKVIQT